MPAFMITIGSTYSDVDYAVENILEFLTDKCSISDKHVVFILNFALRELLNNAVEHGNKLLKGKKVCCSVAVENEILTFDVADEGEGFRIEEIQAGDLVEDIDGTRGRGIVMIRKIGFNLSTEENHIIAVIDLDLLESIL